MSLLKKLNKINIECSNDNWGGFNEQKISIRTIENGITFIVELNKFSDICTISPEPDGCICFDFKYNNNLISVSIDEEYFYYTGHIGTENYKANIKINNLEEIKNLLEKLIKQDDYD